MSRSIKSTLIGATLLAIFGGKASVSQAYSFNDITNWTGSGSNSAAIAIDWSSPEVLDDTSVPAPAQEVEIVFGYHFNGTTTTAAQMLTAIAGANKGLYVVASLDFGTFVEGLGYDLNHNGTFALTDGTTTFDNSAFTAGILDADNVPFNADTFYSAQSSDLYWGGYFGPNWEVWNESGDAGGFTSEPDRGPNEFWTPTDPPDDFSGSQGQWDLAQNGLDELPITQGSWIGFSVARGAFDGSDPPSPDQAAYDQDKQAPAVLPEPTSFWLCGLTGLLALTGRRRRTRFKFAAAALSVSSAAFAADSVTVVPETLTQGTVKSSLTGGTYATETNNLGDWPLNTGSFGGGVSAISFESPDFNGNAFGGNPNTIIAFGNGGGVTLQFATPVIPQAGQKNLGIFTAQAITGGLGSLFNGDMDAAILVSSDNVNWFTLTGAPVTNPTTYTTITYPLNAPTMAYDFGTDAAAWTDGQGVLQSTLSALPIASYTIPMPDDSLFNSPTSTNAQRLALQSDTNTADYTETFGNSGGGNWFNIYGSGLSAVNYVRLNGDPNDPANGGVRLDAVFSAVNPVITFIPEPSSFALISMAGATLLKRSR